MHLRMSRNIKSEGTLERLTSFYSRCEGVNKKENQLERQEQARTSRVQRALFIKGALICESVPRARFGSHYTAKRYYLARFRDARLNCIL